MTELPKTPPRIAASLVDPLTYAEAHGLHNDFTWLRANLPLSRAEVSGFEPFWVVTKHGNRDEEVFDAPFTFRSDRSPNKHISFGTGHTLAWAS